MSALSVWIVIGITIVSVLLAVVIAILCSHVEVKMIVHISGKHERVWVGLRMCYGLIRWRYELNSEKFELLQPKWHQSINKRDLKGLLRTLIGILKRTNVRMLAWSSEIGLGEAPQTAIGAGVLWSLISTITGLASQHVIFRNSPSLEVIPRYNELLFATRFVCIARIRVVHSISAAYLLVTRIMRAKGGKKQWQNIQSKA